MESTANDDRIFIVKRGCSGDFIARERYYCNPRSIGGGNIGPETYDGDILAQDWNPDVLINTLKDYDFIYFCQLDDAFIQKYSECFEDPLLIQDGTIKRISVVGSKVLLE